MNENEMKNEIVNTPLNAPHPMETPQRRDIEFHEQASRPVITNITPSAWLSREEINELQSRWSSIQAQFVDQPLTAVEQADALVTEAVNKIKQQLENHQAKLCDQWLSHPDISTEELRILMQNYRSFLRLLLGLQTDSTGHTA
jgi:hypothetical protein